MVRRLLLFIFLASAVLSYHAIHAVCDDGLEEVRTAIPINPDDKCLQETLFNEMLAFKDNPNLLEKVKIRHLINAVKKSHYTYVRNSMAFNGKRAAEHLMMKYRKRADQIKTASDFIDSIASRSLITGELYLVKLSSGKLYPVKDFLHEELKFVESEFLRVKGGVPS